MQVRNATRRTIRANKANQGMTRRLVGDEGKSVEYAPGRCSRPICGAACGENRFATTSPHPEDLAEGSLQQRLPAVHDRYRMDYSGTRYRLGLIALNRDCLRACDAYRGNLPLGERPAYASSVHRCG